MATRETAEVPMIRNSILGWAVAGVTTGKVRLTRRAPGDWHPLAEHREGWDQVGWLCRSPRDLVAAPDGRLVVTADEHDGVFTIDPAGRVGLLAGRLFTAKGRPPGGERWPDLHGLALDDRGQLWVSDLRNHRLLRLDPATGAAERIVDAGRGSFDGPRGEGRLAHPTDLAADGRGGVYVAAGAGRLRRVDAHGTVTTCCGDRRPEPAGHARALASGPDGRVAVLREVVGPTDLDGRPLLAEALGRGPEGACAIGFDGAGALLVHGWDGIVRRRTAAGTLEPVMRPGGWPLHVAPPTCFATGPDGRCYLSAANDGEILAFGPDGWPCVVARGLAAPGQLAVAADGTVYVLEDGLRVLRIPPGGAPEVLFEAPSPPPLDGPADVAAFRRPRRLATAPDGRVFVLEPEARRVRAITPDGTVTTVCRATPGWPAPMPRHATLIDLATDDHGRLFALDGRGGGIWELADGQPPREVARYVPAQAARRYTRPASLEVAADGAFLVAEPVTHVIYRVARLADGGEVRRFAGSIAGTADGTALGARFQGLQAIARTPDGCLLVADAQRVARVDPTGEVTTLVGAPSGWYGPGFQRVLATPVVAPAPGGGFYACPQVPYSSYDGGGLGWPERLMRATPGARGPVDPEALAEILDADRWTQDPEAHRQGFRYGACNTAGWGEVVGAYLWDAVADDDREIARVQTSTGTLQLIGAPVRFVGGDAPDELQRVEASARLKPIAAVTLVATTEALTASLRGEDGRELRIVPGPIDPDDDTPHPFRWEPYWRDPAPPGRPLQLLGWEELVDRGIEQVEAPTGTWRLAGRGWELHASGPDGPLGPAPADLVGATVVGVEATIGAGGYAAVTLRLLGGRALSLRPRLRISSPAPSPAS